MSRNLIQSLPCALLLVLSTVPAFSQKEITGVVADAVSHKGLPFATIKGEGQLKATISGINGHFTLSLPGSTTRLNVSYISYSPMTVEISSLAENDTVFLNRATSTLGEVIVKPQG